MKKQFSWIESIRAALHYRQTYRLIGFIGALFVVCIVVSNLIAYKVVRISHLILPISAFVFPFSYVLGNIITEVYGFKWTRLWIYVAVFCNVFVCLAIFILVQLPPADVWHHSEFDVLLKEAPRIILASTISYVTGQYLNALAISKLKKRWKGGYLAGRALLSTGIAAVIDSFIFIPMVFYKEFGIARLVHLSISLIIFKLIYEAAALPLTYLVVATLKKIERVDVYDLHTHYSILSFDMDYTDDEINRR